MKKKLFSSGLGSQCPPDKIHVRVYFLQQGSTAENASTFFDYYALREWSDSSGMRVKNWKQLAWSWLFYR